MLSSENIQSGTGLRTTFVCIFTYNTSLTPTLYFLFLSGAELTTLDFGEIWRMDSPTEECDDPALFPEKNCADQV